MYCVLSIIFLSIFAGYLLKLKFKTWTSQKIMQNLDLRNAQKDMHQKIIESHRKELYYLKSTEWQLEHGFKQ